MKKHLIKIFISLLTYSNISANNFGIGLLGGWGLGYRGFQGTLTHEVEKLNGDKKEEKAKGNNRFSNNFSLGGFFQYSFGSEREEFYTFSISAAYVEREINFVFKKDNQTKSNTYYRDVFHKFVQKGIQISQKNYFHLVKGEYIEFGVHCGFGFIYSFSSFISHRDSLPSEEEEQLGIKEFEKMNIFPIVGIFMPFLERMFSLEINFEYWLLNQSKNSDKYKIKYGKNFELGKGHLSGFVELKINIWEMIKG